MIHHPPIDFHYLGFVKVLKEWAMILIVQLESVSKSIPEIIKQASQSQLGILALLIIALFGLAIYFFRGAPVGWRVLIFLVFFCGVVVYAWEINRVAGRPVSVHYVGRVLDKLRSLPLPESKITVTLNNNFEPLGRLTLTDNFHSGFRAATPRRMRRCASIMRNMNHTSESCLPISATSWVMFIWHLLDKVSQSLSQEPWWGRRDKRPLQPQPRPRSQVLQQEALEVF
jgi:hypothetical protein